MISSKWIRKLSTRGNVYYLPEEDEMGKVKDEFLDVVFYIYPTVAEAESGTGSILGGTGFFVSVQSDIHPDTLYVYAVTNDHVITGIKSLGLTSVALRFNTKSGEKDTIEVPVGNWRSHPEGDDLAVGVITVNEKWKYRTVPEEPLFITKHIIDANGVGVGDDSYTLGRFARHSGIAINLPTIRFGHISGLPKEPIIQDDRDSYPQESFLVETHSISGYSGSPVFVEVEPDGREAAEPLTERRAWLLGIDWGHFGFNGEITLNERSGKFHAPSGMMCVVPAWKLSELLHTEELDMHRKENDKKITERKKQSGVSLDIELTKEEFNSTLKKVSRKTSRSKPGRAKPKT